MEQQIGEGEWIATCITARGTHKGSWLGMKPTGKAVVFTGVNINKVVDGRIIEHGGAANLLGPLLEIGAILCGGFALWKSRMREEDEVAWKLSVDDIQNLGFDWPKYALIEEYCVIEDGKVDLTKTIEKMQSSWAYYKKQLDEAFAFKMQFGADYSDFTNRYDDNARMNRKLGEAISYLEEIIEASKK